MKDLVEMLLDKESKGFRIGGCGYQQHYENMEKIDKRLLTQEEKKIIMENKLVNNTLLLQ